MKSNIAIIRGAFLNKYEMQFYEPLIDRYNITAFGSLKPFHKDFLFPTVCLPSPMDVPEFPFKMPILNRVFTDAHYLWGLEKSLQGFDLVHTAETYFHYTQQALNAKKQGRVKKVIATVLENIPFNNEGIHGRKAFKQRSRNELDHIIALTQRTKDVLLLEGADEKKITIISHFIDTKKFTPATPNTLSTKKHIHILFSGRLEKYKGIYELIYAAALLRKDIDLKAYTIEYTFIGDGSEKELLIEKEKQLGVESIIHHRHVDYIDMPYIYRTADIYIAPSKANDTWQEQYNTTLLEAQASGLPIITTYSGGIPENVGDAALLIQPADVRALVDAIKLFIIKPALRDDYAKRARQRAITVHDARIGADKIATVYDRVLS